MKRRLDFLALLIAGTLALTALAGAPARAAAGDGDDSKVRRGVRDRIAGQGHARVLVALPVPSGRHTPEGDMPSVAAVISQRQHIAQAQANVRSRLAGTAHAVIHAYATVPLIAMDVDDAALSRLAASGDVVAVWEDQLRAPTLAQSVPLVQGNLAWSAGYDGSGSVVAILDTGVDKSHPFLQNKVVSEACYSSIVSGHSVSVCPSGQSQQIGAGAGVPCSDLSLGCWHGTHVAGIAAGNGGQAGQTFSGVAKNAQIISVQIFSKFTNSKDCGGSSSCILAWTSDIIAGLERVYALSGTYPVSSVNLSLGGGLYTGACDDEPEKPMIDNLRSVGIATVIAAGNNGSTSQMSSPGCISTAISVGSTNKSDAVSLYSNAASSMSVWAPGESITSSYPGNQWASASGTSMATPHVTGTFAILREAMPDATVDDLISALQQTGVPIKDTRTGGTITKPRVRIYQALQTLGVAPASNPLPTLTSLSPSKATAGGASFTLTVTGSNFVPASVIQWNGAGRATTYVSSGQLTMTVSAGDIANQGSALVTVVNGGPGGGTSNSLTLTIAAPSGFTLTVTKAGGGTVISSPSGINCGFACSTSYASGKKVALQATADSGYRFTGWGGACSGTGSCTVTMTKNTTVTATFSMVYTLNVTVSGSGNVTSTPSGINCGSTCSGAFVTGQQVTLKATASNKYKFSAWTGACTGSSTCTVTMSQARSVGATFVPR